MENLLKLLRFEEKYLIWQLCRINQTIEYYCTSEEIEKKRQLQLKIKTLRIDIDSLIEI